MKSLYESILSSTKSGKELAIEKDIDNVIKNPNTDLLELMTDLLKNKKEELVKKVAESDNFMEFLSDVFYVYPSPDAKWVFYFDEYKAEILLRDDKRWNVHFDMFVNHKSAFSDGFVKIGTPDHRDITAYLRKRKFKISKDNGWLLKYYIKKFK